MTFQNVNKSLKEYFFSDKKAEEIVIYYRKG